MLGLDKFFENKTLMFSAGAVAFLVAAILILFIFRLAFGRRLHMPGGGRARQPRLGVVDAFDLDRQRQLVLVRRDNVEHLVMIGGPNDVLIESQIVRVEARETPRQRDKEPTVAPLTWPAGGTQPPATPPSIAAESKALPLEPVKVALEPVPQAASAPSASPLVVNAPLSPDSTGAPPAVATPPGTVPPTAAPAKRPPFLPLPPRRTTAPPAFGFKPQATPSAPPVGPVAPGAAGEPGQTPAAPTPSPLAPRTPSVAPPAFLRPPRTPATPSAPPLVTPPQPDETLPSAAPVVVAPAVVAPAAVVAPVVVTPAPQAEPEPKPVDALESLEEEMAKLLGRKD